MIHVAFNTVNVSEKPHLRPGCINKSMAIIYSEDSYRGKTTRNSQKNWGIKWSNNDLMKSRAG